MQYSALSCSLWSAKTSTTTKKCFLPSVRSLHALNSTLNAAADFWRSQAEKINFKCRWQDIFTLCLWASSKFHSIYMYFFKQNCQTYHKPTLEWMKMWVLAVYFWCKLSLMTDNKKKTLRSRSGSNIRSVFPAYVPYFKIRPMTCMAFTTTNILVASI